jgi:hypothetical protein
VNTPNPLDFARLVAAVRSASGAVGALVEPSDDAPAEALAEGSDYNFRAGQHELRIYLSRVTPAEVAAVESGPIEFGLFAEAEGLFLITRFGPRLAFDCSYSWHHVSREERQLPPASDEVPPASRALIVIMLVEATTGSVRALRTVSFSPEFTRALHHAISEQAAAPFDAAAHLRWADGITRQFTTNQLWERCKHRCHGGN